MRRQEGWGTKDWLFWDGSEAAGGGGCCTQSLQEACLRSFPSSFWEWEGWGERKRLCPMCLLHTKNLTAILKREPTVPEAPPTWESLHLAQCCGKAVHTGGPCSKPCPLKWWCQSRASRNQPCWLHSGLEDGTENNSSRIWPTMTRQLHGFYMLWASNKICWLTQWKPF